VTQWNWQQVFDTTEDAIIALLARTQNPAKLREIADYAEQRRQQVLRQPVKK
jgi:predicted Zn-ribbon and HTH transcriptional regulator